MNTHTPATHDDGLEWLREVRRRLFQESDRNLEKLGNIYRRVEAEHPEKVIDPRKLLADSLRTCKLTGNKPRESRKDRMARL